MLGKKIFKLLGIELVSNLQNIINVIFERKFKNIYKKVMRDWESENLTPLGRLTILKTLLLANLKHSFASLAIPSGSQLND